MVCLILVTSEVSAQRKNHRYDVILRNGVVVDGSGKPAFRGDVAIDDDRIAAIGDLSQSRGRKVIDCRSLIVAPVFINMLSWATESLLVDGRSQSDIRQGVTLEVFGEGWSLGPLNEAMRRDMRVSQGDLRYGVPWQSLREYLLHLQHHGVACNVASLVGATTVRIHELGYENRAPTPSELARMEQLVREAMEDGALGLGSSLIYAPAFYADTDELVALCKVVAQYDGLYMSHVRSEGNQLIEAVDEFLEIVRRSGVRGEIYHLKAAGKNNWHKLDQVIEKINQARDQGLQVSADMYNYTAGATGLNASMPPWVQEGGLRDWIERMRDPAIRARLILEMRTSSNEWENLLLAAGTPENVLLTGFKNQKMKRYTGKTLGQVARQIGKSAEETAMDLVIKDGSRVEAVYFFMSEENVKKKIQIPWVSFCSDAPSISSEGVFLRSQPHPRTYGSFARLLGKYVREEQVISLPQAIHRLTAMPAENLRLTHRGRLAEGYFADVVVFNPATIADRATYDSPHQYATGMRHVFVNGKPVLLRGKLTGALPGKMVVRNGAVKNSAVRNSANK